MARAKCLLASRESKFTIRASACGRMKWPEARGFEGVAVGRRLWMRSQLPAWESQEATKIYGRPGGENKPRFDGYLHATRRTCTGWELHYPGYERPRNASLIVRMTAASA